MAEIAINLSVSAILVFVIFDDLKNYRIRNQAIGLLIALFIVKILISGAYSAAGSQLAIAIILFLIFLIPYSQGQIGGGDVKLLGVALLWLDAPERLNFAILFLLLTLAYVVAAKFGRAPSRGKTKVFIPFAPSIAGAWLLAIAISMLSS